jgi:hypothetical protein
VFARKCKALAVVLFWVTDGAFGMDLELGEWHITNRSCCDKCEVIVLPSQFRILLFVVNEKIGYAISTPEAVVLNVENVIRQIIDVLPSIPSHTQP